MEKILRSKFILFLILIVPITACKKVEYSCGSNMGILAPESVYEGETINLKPVNAPSGTNTYYNWQLVDMTQYPTGFEVDDADPIKIENVTIFDEGTYTFNAFPNTDGCESAVNAHKYVKVLPLICPCSVNLDDNVLEITEANSTQGIIYMPFNPNFSSGFDTTDFSINNAMSNDPYYFKLDVETKLNKKARTFKLINWINYWIGSEIPEDPISQVWFNINPGTVPSNTYLLEDGINNMYFKHENGILIITFCNVIFRNKFNANEYFTVNGKISVEY